MDILYYKCKPYTFVLPIQIYKYVPQTVGCLK